MKQSINISLVQAKNGGAGKQKTKSITLVAKGKEIGVDLLTGESFVKKRRNQVFATAKNRAKYHNDIANTLRDERATIDKPLNKNFIIIKQIIQNKDTAVFHSEYLSGLGYNTTAFTDSFVCNKLNYHRVYDYVLEFRNNDVLIYNKFIFDKIIKTNKVKINKVKINKIDEKSVALGFHRWMCGLKPNDKCYIDGGKIVSHTIEALFTKYINLK